MADASASPKRLRQRFRRLAARLGKTGWILMGTIHERRISAPRKAGRKSKSYGPYYQWTFKRDARTVTVNLSASQVNAYRRAIDDQRKVEKLLAEMRTLSRQFLEDTTQGVKRRKPHAPRGLRP